MEGARQAADGEHRLDDAHVAEQVGRHHFP
jgi:hypothetical protein